jgi:putative DNA primase/helicase
VIRLDERFARNHGSFAPQTSTKRTRTSDSEISDEASAAVKQLYGKLADLGMPEDESGEPYPAVVPLSPDAWAVFKEVADSLVEEADAPGFPTRLEGAWSELEAYLARLSLILALCRVVEQGGEERVEASDVLMASGLVDYFKAHARRVHVGLHGQHAEDLLAKDLAEFLVEHGREWKDEPNVLHEELRKRKSEALPDRPDELSKMVYAISGRGAWLKAEPGWKKNAEGQSRRAIHLCFRNGVDGVVGVDHETD